MRCLRDGYRVIGTSRRQPDIQHPSFNWVHADLTSLDGAAAPVGAIQDAIQSDSSLSLHGLVHAAGASLRSADLNDPGDGWHRSMALHATTPFALYEALERFMIEADGGSVVLVGSPVSFVGSSKPAYSASKGALIGLCSSLATRGGDHGIRVNVVLPGPTITGMTGDWPEAKRQEIAASTALGRLCTADEIAAVIAFLLGPDSTCITGAAINATGGAHRGIGQ